MSVFSNSPLERGASSMLFNSLEEAGCVAREYAVKLDKILKLVPFLPVTISSLLLSD
jgi:hypothetical protein